MEREYQNLKARWLTGDRDHKLCLRLMFFTWMHWADPPFVTGLTTDSDAKSLWHEIFIHLSGEHSQDAEFLFVAGTMAQIFSYVLGNEQEWKERGSYMISRAMAAGLPSNMFNDGDEYGKYFAHQLKGQAARSDAENF